MSFSPVICLPRMISQLLSHSVFRTQVLHSCQSFDLYAEFPPLFSSNSLVPSPYLSLSLSMNLPTLIGLLSHNLSFLPSFNSFSLQLLRSLNLSILLTVNMSVKLLSIIFQALSHSSSFTHFFTLSAFLSVITNCGPNSCFTTSCGRIKKLSCGRIKKLGGTSCGLRQKSGSTKSPFNRCTAYLTRLRITYGRATFLKSCLN